MVKEAAGIMITISLSPLPASSKCDGGTIEFSGEARFSPPRFHAHGSEATLAFWGLRGNEIIHPYEFVIMITPS